MFYAPGYEYSSLLLPETIRNSSYFALKGGHYFFCNPEQIKIYRMISYIVLFLSHSVTLTSPHYCGKVMALVFLSLNVSFVTTALDKLVVSSLKSEESRAEPRFLRQRGEVTWEVFKPGWWY